MILYSLDYAITRIKVGTRKKVIHKILLAHVVINGYNSLSPGFAYYFTLASYTVIHPLVNVSARLRSYARDFLSCDVHQDSSFSNCRKGTNG